MNRCLMVIPVFFVLAASSVSASEHPNVLLIMTDDQGWGDLGLHGNDRIDTPNLDRLGKSSARFDRFFVSPVCAPTRASLLTGRYDVRTGVTGVTGRREVMRADEVTIAEVFQSAGYATGCFGKWHNGEQYPNHPLGQGFQEFYGFCGGHWNVYFDPKLEHQGQEVQTRGFITDSITEAACQFVSSRHERSWFCYVPYNAPHSPWQLPDDLFKKYTERGFDAGTASAMGMVENLDGNIGRLLRTLEDTGQSERTIVVFLTDNGPNGQRFNGGMRGAKGSVHEGGVRVPCMLRWTGRIRPSTITRIAAHIDLLPTLAELCGVPLNLERPLDGISLVPLLHDSKMEWPDRNLFTLRIVRRGKEQSLRGAVRNQQFRYIIEGDRESLFDLVMDPGQKADLADSHQDQLKSMREAWQGFFNEVEPGIDEIPPIPVGEAASPRVELPAVEATLDGNPVFANRNGYAHDWITDWIDPTDRIRWRLHVLDPGLYEVKLRYACSASNVGSTVRLSVNSHSVQFPLPVAFDEGVRQRPERSMKKGPRLMRTFRSLSIGEVALPSGHVELVLDAPRIPGQSVCELDGLQLINVSGKPDRGQ